jgi:methyl-accepting chemotaxis protein
MEERRAIVRTRVHRDAEIVLGGRMAEKVQCLLRDLTNAGACIALACPHEMPDTFELTLDRGRSLRPCRVRWRSHDRLGVSFEMSATESNAAGVG